ncbi:Crp/Fnr family transcriptional regulator [Pararhizobium sp.]|uniref:Crp/Fnr family transcriptional regulator n=1 Tax=Pararhizobium sp. TaxID=1977563 RepID=UPI00271CB2A1|nr:Crp/Fnr family transcriptional regulator [Pararhizobium sp.]MDO9415850.1 Crp/Fnr family transcriptional regulator [Pararhizobium sp.]
MIEALLLNIESHDILQDSEKDALKSLFVKEDIFSEGKDLVVQGSRPAYSTLILEGFAARYKITADGLRQITALHVPGDFIDLHAFPLRLMDHGIVALSACRVTFADHGALKRVTENLPHLTRLLWLHTLIDGAIHREWIVSMGRKSKKAHLAHLICELYVRLGIVRRTDGTSFYFPLTQMEMADVLGISIVHMNRTIQSLRKDGLLVWINHTITIVDWPRLQEVAEFDPTYLNLSIEPR